MNTTARPAIPLRRAFAVGGRIIGRLLPVFVCVLAAAGAETERVTLADLQDFVSGDGRTIRSFRIEGVACAAGESRTLLALQDHSATVLLEVPPFTPALRAGERWAVEGENCAITRDRFGLQLGTASVVEIDGCHPPFTKSGSVFLEAGMQPLRAEWFNGISIGSLQLEYEGPELPRQTIPGSDFWRRTMDSSDPHAFLPGLDYKSYMGSGWTSLPDFEDLQPAGAGVVGYLDLGVRPRLEDAGLVFTGYLRIPRTGIYTFYDTSDDGSRIRVGDPADTCQLIRLEGASSLPVAKSLQEVMTEGSYDQWVTAGGKVTFAAATGGRIELELIERGVSLSATVMDASGTVPADLLHRDVRVTGICQLASGVKGAARIIVLGRDQLKIAGAPDAPDDVLTTAEQIRRLQPDEARKPFRAVVRGVVTMATPNSLVLQDETGGVFVSYMAAEWVNQPRPGDLWEIEGRTDPGDFSPVIHAERAVYRGRAALPEPIRPTWEQLMNGSLDAEQVEIQGVVISASSTEMTLLTRDGKIRINPHEYYPLPHSQLTTAEWDALAGSVVRVRGVFTASWDLVNGRVKGGELRMGNAMLSVEEPVPRDPFSAPEMRATELLLFTSHAHALKRVRIAAQVLYAQPHEYFLHDGTIGLRIFTSETLPLQPGDQVEAVGFPRLDGPSPVLLEAVARKTGHSPLPDSTRVAVEELSDPRRDSTLVQIEAQLLSDTVRQEERVLEMQAGPHRFVARLRNFRPAVKPIVRSSLLQLTGVYASAREGHGSARPDSFELLLNNPGDVIVLKQGPWWTLRHTFVVISVLAGGLLLSLVWVKMLRQTVAQRTTQLATEIEERQRAEQHRVMEQERARVAQDLHDELGSGLTEAGILSSLAKNPAIPQASKEDYLDQLSETCRSLVTGLDEIVWAVNPRYDSAADLAGYYSLFAQRFLNLAGIACRLEVAESIPAHPLDSRLRHGIFLAFKEALNNVVRHSRATEVRLVIGVDSGELRISVSDNGCGFEPGGDSPGSDGLVGMKRRMQNLGGECRLSSQPGTGTTVEFSLPLERSTS